MPFWGKCGIGKRNEGGSYEPERKRGKWKVER
jgi:hypothetical protein